MSQICCSRVVINRALTHTHPHPAKTCHTHPNSHTCSQKKFTLTHTHPHPAKKRSHLPKCSQKKRSYAPTPTKKRSCPPTFTHTQPKKDSYPPHLPSPIQKMVTSSLEKVTHPHITEGKNVTCKTRDLYLKSIIFSQY